MVKVQGCGEPGGSWLLEERNTGRLPVKVARALVQPQGGMVPVCLLNPRPETVVVHKGTKIATLEPLEEQQEICEVAARPAELKKRILENIVEKCETELTKQESEQLTALLFDYADIFSEGKSDLGHTNLLQHHIDTGSSQLIRCPPHRTPLFQREEVKRLTTDMLEKGVIQNSSSPWSTPVVLVQKEMAASGFVWITESSIQSHGRMHTHSTTLWKV